MKRIKEKLFDPISISAIHKLVNNNKELKSIWKDSKKLFPDFNEHFTEPLNSEEAENRVRLLVVKETEYIKDEILELLKTKNQCTYADIGDSDGSVRLLLSNIFSKNQLVSTGINLQQHAVDKMKSIGLDAICADAQKLAEQGINYDIVSVFETLEHLSDPIGFLIGLNNVVNNRLIISVPYIRKSRVRLSYIKGKWPKNKTATIENTHIFEFSPKDWEKIFLHTGWKIEKQDRLLNYHPKSVSRILLQTYWNYVSYDSFWFVTLVKDDHYSSKYVIE